jgi:putative membrane protein
MMYWYNHDMSWWGFAGMGIGMVLFWALVILGIAVLVRSSVSDRPQRLSPAPSPEQVLANRLARGQISETQYRDRLAVLRDYGQS